MLPLPGGVPSGLLDIASFPPLAYRRGPDSIFRETQRYSFNLLLAFFIQLLPALLHSAYDEAVGHLRRYSIRSLRDSAARSNLQVTKWSYWGLPLVPTLVLRRLWLLGNHDKDKVVSAGFSSRTKGFNQLLGLVSRFEPTPQRLLGTSVMAVLEAGGRLTP